MRKTIISLILACTAQGVSAQSEGESFDCVMDPSEIVLVSSPTGGILADVSVQRGDVVEAGQVLAQLTSDIEEASVALLEARTSSDAPLQAQLARRDLVQTRYDRSQELRDRNVISQDQFAEISAELIAANSLVRQAELDQVISQQELARARAVLDQRTIRSPIDGVVVSRNNDAGEFLAQDDYVVSVVALDPLYIEAFLPIEVYDQVAIGTMGTVEPGAPIGGLYEAEVIAVDQVFDAASGTFGVRLELPNPASALPAGQRCMLSFVSAG